MNNEIVNKSFLTRLKGTYQAKYGIEMDEWSAMVLYEISENFNKNNKVTESTIKEIEKASNLIKGQIKPIHFSDAKQAFQYGLGKNFPFGIAFIILLMFGYFLITNSLAYKEIKGVVNDYPNFRAYKLLIQSGKIEVINGRNYLILSKKKEGSNDVMIGEEFFFDSNDKNKIRIPLGRK
jgi:hypothetical protein